jgi:hypothetical protein
VSAEYARYITYREVTAEGKREPRRDTGSTLSALKPRHSSSDSVMSATLRLQLPAPAGLKNAYSRPARPSVPAYAPTVRASRPYSQRSSSSPDATQASFHAAVKSSRISIWMTRNSPLPTRAAHAYTATAPLGRKNGSAENTTHAASLAAQLPWCSSAPRLSPLVRTPASDSASRPKNRKLPIDTRYTACWPNHLSLGSNPVAARMIPFGGWGGRGGGG